MPQTSGTIRGSLWDLEPRVSLLGRMRVGGGWGSQEHIHGHHILPCGGAVGWRRHKDAECAERAKDSWPSETEAVEQFTCHNLFTTSSVRLADYQVRSDKFIQVRPHTQTHTHKQTHAGAGYGTTDSIKKGESNNMMLRDNFCVQNITELHPPAPIGLQMFHS